MVLKKAQELGLELLKTEEYMRMQIAQSALEADTRLCGVLSEFKVKQSELIDMLQKETGADRLLIAAVSRDVEALQTQLLENKLFSAAIEAQNDFQNLMAAVNREIASAIGMDSEENSGGCGGSCSGCAGCTN
ncbi:MAG: YlbF family regulator [Clostridiales bacterium]|jgi:cell fate (sporulation/competence/biofilm development) regulator YlbF (YheA/YmcA/DUF963 family)|nr:YlbF family regulator [Clostridiales bacterium]